ncbi:hypothetical protein K458DRAFT_486194 [Lentithecium fluviatile CBS 122367]|uniref:Uncharacterized protein n=1 Tax=Lentithecium fluviatile CBS 122367 TaxID=1168545 RepID=A0A6G1J6W9_9PLEO|nr:hypothetical protein K458DRAFT_486194 [Lentithecium fluviatile CBS 122367]
MDPANVAARHSPRKKLVLTHAFSKGWRSLPTELQLQILSYLLSFPIPNQEDAIAPKKYAEHFKASLLPLLVVPELAELSKEAYYTTNTFMIGTQTSLGRRMPLHASQYIRKLVIWVQLGVVDWVFLQRDFNQRYENLRGHDNSGYPAGVWVSGCVRVLEMRFIDNSCDRGFYIGVERLIFGKIGMVEEEESAVKTEWPWFYPGMVKRESRRGLFTSWSMPNGWASWGGRWKWH